MATQDKENISEMANGWPLGLGNMNMALRVIAAGNQNASEAEEPCSLHIPSYSFSSLSSSNLDTESTISLCPERSVSLGRLMGIKPVGNRRKVFHSNTNHFEQQNNVFHSSSYPKDKEASRKLCVPLLYLVIAKLMTKSRS